MSFLTVANKLVPFETFDRAAFIGDAKVPQDVCNLVLSLGQAYNDFGDVFIARRFLEETGVNLNGPRTVHLGLRNGLENTIVRVQTGFIHELLKLLQENQKVILNSIFQRIVRQMSKPGRQAWKALFDVATSKSSDDPLAQALAIIRNKVAFHYDAKQLHQGYKNAFLDTTKYGDPLISRGSNLEQTRFYFADASSQAYILLKAKEQQAFEFVKGRGVIFDSINQALYEIVTRFIQMRSAWSQPKLD
jgi:hypothetical protein